MPSEAERSSIYEMRQSGAALDQIAVHFGMSRERVRQLLVRHHGSTRLGDLLSTTEVRCRAGCTYNDILRLRQRDIIRPAKVVGRYRTLWKPETVDTIIAYDRDDKNRRCAVCSGSLPGNRRAYCSRTCQVEGKRKAHNERQRKWRRNHPEQDSEIKHRYRARKSVERYRTGQYVVTRRIFIQRGTRLKVLGYGTTRRRFLIKCGGAVIEAPCGCLKKQ